MARKYKHGAGGNACVLRREQGWTFRGTCCSAANMVSQLKGTDTPQEQTSLIRPLPPVRIEVPVAGPWNDLVGGLRALTLELAPPCFPQAAQILNWLSVRPSI